MTAPRIADVDEAPPSGEQRARHVILRTGTRVLAVVAVLLAVGAGVAFSRLRQIEFVDLPLASTHITFDGDLVLGSAREGLPRRGSKWDGEPARGVVLDRGTGRIVAPALLTPGSFSLNRNGVLWLPEDGCRFVLERSQFESARGSLVLRCERLRSAVLWYALVAAAIAAGLAAVACGQIQRVCAARAEGRVAAVLNELRVSAFVLIGLLSGVAFFPGLPVVEMNSDTTLINAFAAGWHAPGSFARDALLADPRNFAWYTPAYVRFVEMWGAAGFHYDTSRAALAVCCTWLGLFGYYRLFRQISGSAAYAFAAAIGLWFLKAGYPPNEVWTPEHIMPRTVYGALLPWVIVLSFRCLPHFRRWSLAAAASGLLFYVHPVSSPALTGAVLMGFVCAGRGRWLQRLGWGMLAAGAALLVMFPYTLAYTSKYKGTVVDDPAIMADAVELMRARLAPGFLDLGIYTRDLCVCFLSTPRYWLAATAFVWLLRHRRESLAVRMLFGMTLGFVIVTYYIPAVDLTLASRLGRLPFQVDLIRNLRYADVLVLAIGGVLVRSLRDSSSRELAALRLRLSAGWREQTREWSVPGVVAAAVLLVIACYGGSLLRTTSRLVCLAVDNVRTLSGRHPDGIRDDLELIRAIEAWRRPEEVVAGPLFLRQAHVPLAITTKDLGALAYANPVGLVTAQRQLAGAEQALQFPIDRNAVQVAADSLAADLLVLERRDAGPGLLQSSDVIFQNATKLLVRVARETGPYPSPTPIQSAARERLSKE